MEDVCGLILKDFQRRKETLIIVGLGNPGDKYQDTFHNMGYKVIEALEQKTGVKCKKSHVFFFGGGI